MKFEFGEFGLVEYVLYHMYIPFSDLTDDSATEEEIALFYTVEMMWNHAFGLARNRQKASTNSHIITK